MIFPYGISDFRKITTKGYFYCDRTDRIPLIEKGDYLLFLRPRRFGKSLLLSMLANYYDVARKDQFEEMFGNLRIGQNPTPLHNSYFILKWDFSCVDPFGNAENIRRALHDHINSGIEGFIRYYENFDLGHIRVDYENAVSSIASLITAVRMTPYPIYLLIDEYDNFANEVMMGVRQGKGIYEALVYEEGPLKTLFKTIKSSTSDSVFDRIFITGVSPVVMSDITSGYNIGENIYLDETFNDLCGFREEEIRDALRATAAECGLDDRKAEEALSLMRVYYNGHMFSQEAEELVYNPTLSLYFMKAFHNKCKYPREMLDENLAADEAKLRYISNIAKGRELLAKLMRKDDQLISRLSSRFGIHKMLSDHSRDSRFIASFLYYFGVLTINRETEEGEINLKIPNLVIRSLYAERIREMLLPDPNDRDDGVIAAKELYTKGNMKPLCDFIETSFFKVFHNPDYKWANELTVKTIFLTLLYNDTLFIMDSEQEIGRRYTDLTMIVRPDMRRFKVSDILIEFKYVKLKEAKITGEKAGKLTAKELQELPVMKENMEQAKNQVREYGDELERKYSDLRLRRYAVVSLGFERLWWEEILGRDAK